MCNGTIKDATNIKKFFWGSTCGKFDLWSPDQWLGTIAVTGQCFISIYFNFDKREYVKKENFKI